MSCFFGGGRWGFDGEIFSGHNRSALLPFLYQPNSDFSASTVFSQSVFGEW